MVSNMLPPPFERLMIPCLYLLDARPPPLFRRACRITHFQS